jgi:hypothetical protein
MGLVVNITPPSESEMLAACDEMRARIGAGEVHSLMVMAHMQGELLPRMIVLGTYKDDLFRAMAALERGRIEVHRKLDFMPAVRELLGMMPARS